MFSEKVAPALLEELHHLSEGFVEFPDASGALRDYEGCVYRNAAGAWALRQLPARFLSAPAIRRRNRAMWTNVAAEGVAVSPKMVRRGSKPGVPHLAYSDGPRGYNANAPLALV